jgi:hypothetical protein
MRGSFKAGLFLIEIIISIMGAIFVVPLPFMPIWLYTIIAFVLAIVTSTFTHIEGDGNRLKIFVLLLVISYVLGSVAIAGYNSTVGVYCINDLDCEFQTEDLAYGKMYFHFDRGFDRDFFREIATKCERRRCIAMFKYTGVEDADSIKVSLRGGRML